MPMRSVVILVLGLLVACQSVPEDGQWIEYDLAGCLVWSGKPIPGETASWVGPCVDGKAHGTGTVTWNYRKDGEDRTDRYTGGVCDAL